MKSRFVPEIPASVDKNLFAAPVFEDVAKTRSARLANTILLLILVVLILVPAAAAFAIPAQLGEILVLAVPMAFIVLGSLWLLRRGLVRLVGFLLVGSFYLIITVSLVTYQGIRDLGSTGYFLIVAMAGLLLDARSALVTGVVCGLTALAVYLAEINGMIVVTLAPVVSFADFTALAVMLALVTLLLYSATRQGAESLEQATRSSVSLGQAYEEVAASRDALQARTEELQRHSAYLEGSAEVAQAASSMLEVDLLMERVVELIRQRFGLYYVGLFRLDENQQRATLRAGTGEEGRAMLARRHSIPVGEGMVGWCIAHHQARVAPQAALDVVRLATAELPESRAEAALPLRSRGQVVGALTVQHAQAGFFDADTVTVLQTMADQVGVALDNARLFAESQTALEAERRAYGEISRSAWVDLVRAQGELGYVSRPGEPVRPVSGGGRREAVDSAPAPAGAAGSSLVLPIRIRDHEIGTVTLRKRDGAGGWTAEETALMQSLAAQVETALDSARLYQDTQQRAFRDRLLAEVVGRVRESLEIETVLRTAAQEIRQALNLPEVVVRLWSQPEVSGGEGV
jgi:GAF domain-containing protein